MDGENVRRLVPFEDLPDEEVGSRELDDDTLASYQKQFNYSAEELDSVIRVLGENGQEAVGSMGDDTPFAVLSSQPRIIYDYFRQQFARSPTRQSTHCVKRMLCRSPPASGVK